MTKQEIFDILAAGLLKQNAKSQNAAAACLYRGPNGTKCAVGMLIKDEFYTPDMEGFYCINDKVREALFNSGVLKSTHIEQNKNILMLMFLSDLQAVHDFYPVQRWREQLQVVANGHKLNADVLEKVGVGDVQQA